MKKHLLLLTALLYGFAASAQNTNLPSGPKKFEQLDQQLPTPNVYRTGSGAPGHKYWQQKADYDIKVRLDDEKQQVYGTETITYTNNSPNTLNYLWLQLDQNVRAKNAMGDRAGATTIDSQMGLWQLRNLENQFDGGFKIDYVQDKGGKALPYIINETMMRIDLPSPLSRAAAILLASNGGTMSTTACFLVAARVTNILKKMATIYIPSPSFIPAWPSTTTSTAGSISNLWVGENLPSLLAILR